MKFGVREICDVVLKAKAPVKIGKKQFYANEPVIYFDTLKTSSVEGAATTVYAQGGRGNTRLMAWEGERTLTFNMEDALISPEGFMILSGAGLVDGSEQPIYQHIAERVDAAQIVLESNLIKIPTTEVPFLPKDTDRAGNFAYVMFIKDGEIISEPYIPVQGTELGFDENTPVDDKKFVFLKVKHDNYDVPGSTTDTGVEYAADGKFVSKGALNKAAFDSVMVDYYTERKGEGAMQIDITPDKFGGNYYLEASTLFRDQATGKDMPAEFVIPNCKVQSNFTFTMSGSGDPSTFNFVLDAFPDYTRFDHSKKVLAAIQIIREEDDAVPYRLQTDHAATDLAWN